MNKSIIPPKDSSKKPETVFVNSTDLVTNPICDLENMDISDQNLLDAYEYEETQNDLGISQ